MSSRRKNPGARDLAEWTWAIAQVCRKRDEKKGRCSKSYDADTLRAVELIRATPASKRREFAAAQASKRRRNPAEDDAAIEAARKMYEDFHGRAADRVNAATERVEYTDTLADCGALIELQVILPHDDDAAKVPLAVLAFTGRQVRVAVDAHGNELHLVGGNQAIDLARLGLEAQQTKPAALIGEAYKITYLTSKHFHDFEPSQYEHEFGEETGERPQLAYDPRSKKLFLVGGAYIVRPEGIRN